MHWPRDAATRRAEREEKDNLERFLRRRAGRVPDAWVETVTEARRHAEAIARLERRLQTMPRR